MPSFRVFEVSSWLVLAFLFHAAAATWQGSSRTLLRDVIEPEKPCRNTVQGLYQITDDQGQVCKRDDVNSKTGCCRGGTLHDCSTCDLNDRCCLSYEQCVSCCLKPEHKAGDMAKVAFRAPTRSETGHWADAFEYCKGICRTHGGSTMHENAYISPRHHCFSRLGKPLVSPPIPAGSLDGVTVLLGGDGMACEEVCSKDNKSCSAQHMRFINSCDKLREFVGCEAGCEAEAFHEAFPAYVMEEAPKQKRPAICLIAEEAAPAFGCTGKEPQVRRLCACTGAPAKAP